MLCSNLPKSGTIFCISLLFVDITMTICFFFWALWLVVEELIVKGWIAFCTLLEQRYSLRFVLAAFFLKSKQRYSFRFVETRDRYRCLEAFCKFLRFKILSCWADHDSDEDLYYNDDARDVCLLRITLQKWFFCICHVLSSLYALPSRWGLFARRWEHPKICPPDSFLAPRSHPRPCWL